MGYWGRRGLITAGMAALGSAQPACAEWFEATSAHFVVYANGSEQDVRRQAEQLERFDSLIRYFNAIPAREEDGSNKLTVYVVANDAAVRRMFGAGGTNIAGFYQGRASGSVAFTPARGQDGSSPGSLQPQIVLFHEYAHHLMLANTAVAVPAWYGEGYAEFLSTARFEKDVVWVGAAAQHRAYELLMEKGLSAEQLFSLDRAKMSESQIASLYARGWLMTHYMTLDKDRRRQLNAYLLAFNAGKPGNEAARGAFGDLRALDKSLAGYLGKSTLPAYKIPLTRLPEPQVTLRSLTPGEKAMIGLRMRSDRGVNRDSAQPILAEAGPIATRYADDPVVQGWFAEMALDAQRYDLADAAADRALAIDPKSAQALVYKAQVQLRRAAAAKSRDPAVWKEARGWLLRANRLDPNDAYALMLFYSSFGMARMIPTDNAKAALQRAHELVPQDPGVGYAYAIQSLVDGRTDDARAALRPLAYSAHSGPDNPAAKLLVQLDAGKSGPAAMAAAGAKVEDADQLE